MVNVLHYGECFTSVTIHFHLIFFSVKLRRQLETCQWQQKKTCATVKVHGYIWPSYLRAGQ